VKYHTKINSNNSRTLYNTFIEITIMEYKMYYEVTGDIYVLVKTACVHRSHSKRSRWGL